MGKKTITNEIVDQRLEGRNIKRLDDYAGNKIKMRWQHTANNCNNIWLATSNGVLNAGSGCPKCIPRTPHLSTEEINKRLEGRNIRMISNYAGVNSITEWQCLNPNCNRIWTAIAASSLNHGHGCANCSGNLKLTNEIVDQKLEGRNIKRLDDYNGGHHAIHFQCQNSNTKCNHIWAAQPNNVLNDNGGCPKCARCGSFFLSNEEIDKAIEGRYIKRADSSLGCMRKINWQCLNDGCGCIWATRPNNIISSGSGCPACKNKNENNIFKIFKKFNLIFDYHKNIKHIDYQETKKYFVDFYFPHKNIIIEYNGKQHYEPRCFGGIDLEIAELNLKNQKIRDQYIRDFCGRNNLYLIEIDGRIYNREKLKRYVNDDLIKLLT